MKKNKRSPLHFIMVFLNIVAALLLLISYSASFINPSAFWYVAFVGLANPVLVLINLFFVIYWLFRLRFSFIISLICLLVGWNFHLNSFALQSPAKVSVNTDSVLRVMSYNAHLFLPLNQKKYDKQSKREVIDLLLREEPGIICFQEFYTRRKGEYNTLDTLKKQGSLKYTYLEIFEQNTDEILAMAIFSKYKIINKGHIPFYDRAHANTCIYADILFKGDTIRIINVHLQSISFQPEDYEYLNKVTKQAEPDMASSKRIGVRLKRAFIKRSGQSEKIAEFIQESPYPVIVCGDFNDTPVSYAYNTLSRGLKNTFREKGSGFGITYGGDFPNFQIDYILCSPSFRVLNYTIIKKKYSDHYPIISDLEL